MLRSIFTPFQFKHLIWISVLVIFVLFVLYLWQVTAIISNTYLLKSISGQIRNLYAETKDLEIELLKAESAVTLEKKLSTLSYFEPIEELRYLQVIEGVVVQSDYEPSP